MSLLGRERQIEMDDITIDYVRLSSLELVAHELNTKHIRGSVAELGVYKGDFAKKINQLFPNKKFYLFDTFEGLSKKDIKVDVEEAYASDIDDLFLDTSVAMVLEKMPFPSQCIVKKGYFPTTAEDLEEKFAFVSLDADLFTPTYEGLKYFYNRLVRGGYIFIHDYNNIIFGGVKEAVNRFCDENQVSIFPLTDTLGSAIITK
jgi:O-methyltransferase